MWLDFLSITRSSSSSARRWWPGGGQGTLYLTIMIAAVAFQLPHSREQEAEADRIEVMARAAYEPRAAVEVWRKMPKVASGGTPSS